MATTLVETLDKLHLADTTPPNASPQEDGSDAGSDDDAPEDAHAEGGAGAALSKKKKKKPKKKKKAAAMPEVQSEPPRVGLSKIFTKGVFPVGEEQEYVGE